MWLSSRSDNPKQVDRSPGPQRSENQESGTQYPVPTNQMARKGESLFPVASFTSLALRRLDESHTAGY